METSGLRCDCGTFTLTARVENEDGYTRSQSMTFTAAWEMCQEAGDIDDMLDMLRQLAALDEAAAQDLADNIGFGNLHRVLALGR